MIEVLCSENGMLKFYSDFEFLELKKENSKILPLFRFKFFWI